MRIIAGTAGGIPLLTPKSDARPTTDRVRSAIFSMLAHSVHAARVVDLFAGSGALGLEALSRGAASAVFVDNDPKATTVIQRNAEKARLLGAVKIETTEVFTWLQQASSSAQIVFADPPYKKRAGDSDMVAALLAAPGLLRILAPAGMLVLESLAERDSFLVPAPWTLLEQRAYGMSQVSFLQLRQSS